MKTLINPRTSVLTAMILSAGIWRFFVSSGYSPFTNLTPVGAMALFGGCYFADKGKAFLLPLFTLWLSDLFLSYFIYFHEWRWFYGGWYFTYGSFALIVLLGRYMKKVTIKNVVWMSIVAALIHWLITDFGVWLNGTLYPKTPEGLVACYVAALPYVKNMLTGNLVFGAILFGSFEWAQKKYPLLQLSND